MNQKMPLSQSTVYVIGHRNPDCDSIVSSIAYATVKNAQSPGYLAVPARIGPINRETAFVLEEFGFAPPLFLPHAHPQVKDASFDPPMLLPKDATLLEVWTQMQKERAVTACVVDDAETLAGVVTIGDIAKAQFKASIDDSRYTCPIANLAEVLMGEILVQGADYFAGSVVVGDTSQAQVSADNLFLIGDRTRLQMAAIKQGVGVLVVTGDADVAPQVVELAAKQGTTLLRVPLDTFSCTSLLWQAVPVDQVMTSSNIRTVNTDDLLREVSDEMKEHPFKLYPVLDEHNRPIGVIGRNHLADRSAKQFILVDHNEKNQSIDGIEQARILEVIDHHRISAVETDQPILFVNRPWGATATIISQLSREQHIQLRPQLAGLMCGAILSDTLAFRSPTSTSQDEHEAHYLAQIAGIELDSLAHRLLQAASDIEQIDPQEILRSDFKEFTVGKSKVGIGQTMIYGQSVDALKKDLLRAMKHLMDDAGYALVALMLTNVLNRATEMLWVAKDPTLAKRAFKAPHGATSFTLPEVMSRKRQVVPAVIKAIREQD
ncbi:MAG: putative manganese-dependent inorganic diphosphatase [Limnochordia bacterium]|jgi:manganese-dependent inorganic pyrophosphatase|nr:putative manganese-dependent inorganic diphosphatase [Limnochordia bacterium]